MSPILSVLNLPSEVEEQDIAVQVFRKAPKQAASVGASSGQSKGLQGPWLTRRSGPQHHVSFAQDMSKTEVKHLM